MEQHRALHWQIVHYTTISYKCSGIELSSSDKQTIKMWHKIYKNFIIRFQYETKSYNDVHLGLGKQKLLGFHISNVNISLQNIRYVMLCKPYISTNVKCLRQWYKKAVLRRDQQYLFMILFSQGEDLPSDITVFFICYYRRKVSECKIIYFFFT